VWNPYGDEKMAYDKFVCIENGVINEPITLEPGTATLNTCLQGYLAYKKTHPRRTLP